LDKQGRERLGDGRGMFLVTISAEGFVSAVNVLLKTFEGHLLTETVYLIRAIGSRPIHPFLKLFHRLDGKLDLATTRLAVLQLLDVVVIEREALEIGELRRIAEFTDCKIPG
jgi:hypothetical protein